MRQDSDYYKRIVQVRQSARAPFAGVVFKGYKNVSKNISILLVFILMSLPLFTTFNEILTKIVEKTGTYSWLTTNVVPFQTKAVSVAMHYVGIDSVPTATSVFISNDDVRTNIYFSWNCLGWQSLVMLALTLITGLQGKASISSKILVILFGISGTFMVNIIRISTVVLVAHNWGQLAATIVHDYGGTLFTVGWFLMYWWLAYKYILGESAN